MPKVLLIEDDIELSENLAGTLARHKFSVDVAHDGISGLEHLSTNNYDLAILDWQLPLLEGPNVCQRHREQGGVTLILMLTARKTTQDKVQGFDCGADDYLVKPFAFEELFARMKNLLRHPRTVRDRTLTAGCLTLNPDSSMARVNDKALDLRRREYQILELLMHNRGRLFTCEEIISRLWPTETDTNAEAVRCHITRLRKKMALSSKDAKDLIETVYGMGYKIG